MDKRISVKTFVTSLQKHKDKLDSQRNALELIHDELGEMLDSVSDASENIQYAIDRLSEIV